MLPYKELKLERVGPASAQAGVVSLPLPAGAADLAVDYPGAGSHVLGRRERDSAARRVLVCIADKDGVPDVLGVHRVKQPAAPRSRSSWQISTPITRKKLDYAKQVWTKPDHVRGTPVADCAAVEGALELTFGGETIRITAGATGVDDGCCPWQSVQLERLWSNAAAEAIRVGGVIYNGDTYLQAHFYLVLYASGVVSACCHFVNTKLHIKGYDFRGLPFIRFEGKRFRKRDVTLPKAGFDHRLGALALNLNDAAMLCSDRYPGRLQVRNGKADWYPVHRIFNPQKPHGPGDYWDVGMARTVRFTFALGDAPPIVTRYRVPSWWYGVCGEPWGAELLPADGPFAGMRDESIDNFFPWILHGRFDAGRTISGSYGAGIANDGHTGTSFLLQAYHTGRDDLYDVATAYFWYWADLAVDHSDFTVHQWIGGWPWKTCAYAKFRDLVYGYLETGDPWLADTVENVADAYWMWFRANWPRASIGRDMFPTGDWALLRRFFDTERSRRRTRQLIGMLGDVIDSRGSPGGQMGAGPHPGYVDALYMIGACMTVCIDLAEAEYEAGDAAALEALLPILQRLHAYFIRDDMMIYPAFPDLYRPDWDARYAGIWSLQAARIYPAVTRFWPTAARLQRAGLKKMAMYPEAMFSDWAKVNRSCQYPSQALSHDAFVLGARVEGNGVVIEPCGSPEVWAEEQTAHTPWGKLSVRLTKVRGGIECTLAAARAFPVTMRYNGKSKQTSSTGSCRL